MELHRQRRRKRTWIDLRSRRNGAKREDGAKPVLQRAASVEVAEERAVVGLAGRRGRDAVKIGEERVGEILRGDGIGFTAKNSRGRGAQVAAIRNDEKFPGSGLTTGARGSEAQILQMKRAEKFFQIGT